MSKPESVMWLRRGFSLVLALIETMRPLQWSKNVVIFAALVFDRQLGINNLPPLLRTLAGFVIFCLVSGVVYLLNDLADREADRQHPQKRHRPIPSGRLPIPVAVSAGVLLLAVLLPFSFRLSTAFGVVTVGYFLLNIAYSVWLKHVPLIDVFCIALGFVLRVEAGVTLIHVARFSPWLYVVTTLGSLYIGFGKRRAELASLANSNATRKVLSGYTLPMLDQYITIVSATTIVAYSLYTFSAPNLPDNHAMMLTIPFVIYGVFRYLYLIQTTAQASAPVEDVLLRDRPMQITILLWGAAVLLIFYIF